MDKKRYDLEERLINFSVMILKLSDQLPKGVAAKHLGGQLIRSGTSPALNYGEAQAAESAKDFIHKMKICLKELRESHICLKIIARKPFLDKKSIIPSINECNELVAIFVKSVNTKKNNMNK